jgi:hypothetical protein
MKPTKKALVTDARSIKQFEKAQAKEDFMREEDKLDLRHISSSPQGRRFLWRLIGECKTFEKIWDASAKIHFNEGRRSIGIQLLAEVMQADPKGYLLMQQEAMLRTASEEELKEDEEYVQ